MSNKLNPFEEQLKKAAEEHTVPYDANQWTQLEKHLDSPKPNGLRNLGMAAIAVILVGTAVYFSLNKEENVIGTQELVSETVEVIEDVPVTMEDEILVAIETLEEERKSTAIKKETPKPASVQELEKKAPINTPMEKVEEPISVTEINPNEEREEQPVLVDAEIFMDELELPNVKISSTSICAGLPVTASLSDPTIENVVWQLSDGTVFNGKELNHIFLYGGTFQIKAYLVNYERFTEAVSIHIKPKPNAIFTIKEEYEEGMIPVQKFSLEVEGEASYSWNLGDGTQLKGEQISHTYTKEGEYPISLRVYSKQGCLSVNYNRVVIEKEFNLLATNSFTPNGDGRNDYWFPKVLSTGYFEFKLQVLDKNSKLVFETKDPNQKFDGKVNGKFPASGDLFIWRVTTTDPNGVMQEFGGTFISF